MHIGEVGMTLIPLCSSIHSLVVVVFTFQALLHGIIFVPLFSVGAIIYPEHTILNFEYVKIYFACKPLTTLIHFP